MKALSVHHVSFREHETFLKHFSDGPKRDKGQLFLYLDLPDNPGAEDSLVEKLWRALHDHFFNCQSDDQFFCFEEALKKANEVLDQESKKRESGTIGRIHAIAALLQEDSLHFSRIGHAAVSLQRGDSLVTDDSDTDSDEGFLSMSSVTLAAEDTVVFTTRSLPFDPETLLEVFTQKGAKASSQLKNLAKQKELTGLVSYWTFPGVDAETPAEAVAEEVPEETPTDDMPPEDAPKKRGKRGKKALGALSQKVKGVKVDKAKETVKDVFSGVSSKLSGLVKKPDRIKQVNRRYIMLAVIGLIAIFAVGVTIQSNYREQAQQAQYYESLLSQVKMNITHAEQRFLVGEKQDATDFLNKAAAGLTEIDEAGFFQSDVAKLKNDMEVYRDSFDAIIRVKNPTVFADLTEKGTVDALGIINTEDQRNFVYEPRRLFETLLDKVQEPLQIDSEEIVIAGAELADFNLLSFITRSGQVIEYEVRNGLFAQATTQDDTWQKGVDVKTFNGEYIYILDPASNAIWKYRRLRSGYSTATTYNTEGDLSEAVSLAIDGDIYVLLRDGNILRFRRGALVPYDLRSQPSVPMENPSRLFTLPEANHLYVLDSDNSRVVIYSKDESGIGEYKNQVVFETLAPGEIRDFYIDKDEQKLTVLTADQVYITDI